MIALSCFPLLSGIFWDAFAHACSVLFHWHLVRNQNVLREALKRKLKNEVGNNSRRRHQPPKQNKGRSYRMSNRDENICFQFDGLKWMWVWQPVPGPVQRADRTSPPQHQADSREPQISYWPFFFLLESRAWLRTSRGAPDAGQCQKTTHRCVANEGRRAWPAPCSLHPCSHAGVGIRVPGCWVSPASHELCVPPRWRGPCWLHLSSPNSNTHNGNINGRFRQ